MTQEIIIDYALYDGRFLTDPDSSTCYEFCDTLKEARRNRKGYGNDTVVVKVLSHQTTKGFEIISKEIVP